MAVEFIVGFVVVLLVLSLVAEPVSAKLRLPHSSLLVLLGAVVAYVVTLGFGVDTGLRAVSFHDLVFYVFLPVLIFEAAYKIPLQELRANLGAVLFLAIVGVLVTTGISAAILYAGFAHPTGFPWIAALIAGALLAATDPVAVSAQLKTLGAPERLGVLLEGESLFNDAAAIVLFSMLIAIATTPAAEVTPAGAVLEFARVFAGGAFVGAAVGALASIVVRRATQAIPCAGVMLATAYGSFLIAEGVLHVSGVMGSLVAGLMLSRAMGKRPSREPGIDFLLSTIAYLANGSVFLLMGVTVTVSMFTERWLAMLIAIGAVLVARALTTYGGLSVANLVMRDRVPTHYQTVIVWGGLRGAVTLALALALPVELEYWWTVQSMAFGVVLFTLLVQAPSMPRLLERTGLTSTRF